ncbi:MAG TPA: histidine kinase, partial [Stellaceae bacterium]|nr:histidine kinase [Stellaceae bacterium]
RGTESPMSLRFRLIGMVCVALVVSLALGAATAWINASRSVRTEMRSALLVGRQTIENAIERLQNSGDPLHDLEDLVASFDGNRHLRVRLIGEGEAITAPIVERPPFGPLPGWFIRLIGVGSTADRVPIVVRGRDDATIVLETDPHNEILEVWNEFTGSLVTPAVFSSLTILLIYVFIGRALRPLAALAVALEQVGDGRYRTRIAGRLGPELARLRDSFNRMAARLADADAENRRLNEQLLTLQEQERSELARDLHDEVSPFLFAINIDATAASRLLNDGRADEARDRVQSIADAVRPMQRQVRSMLGRLRPIGLDEFGLREAIENMIAFWRQRRPEIRYQLAISTECEDPGELVGLTICRIVQESLSNAVRHAGPTLITVSVDREDADVRVEVADDGGGMPEPRRPGYGLVGIGERVKAIGGSLSFSNKPAQGFAVAAVLPCASEQQPACVSVQEEL